jgi:hypothetical protein
MARAIVTAANNEIFMAIPWSKNDDAPVLIATHNQSNEKFPDKNLKPNDTGR